jgi:hypothetical protein
MQEGSTLHIGDGPFAVESFSQSICSGARFRVVAEPLHIGCAVLRAECRWLSYLVKQSLRLRLGGIAAFLLRRGREKPEAFRTGSGTARKRGS